MTIKQFIEKAIEGGWETEELDLRHWEQTSPHLHRIDQARLCAQVLLDPKAWQAVGKEEGWETDDRCWGCRYDEGATNDTPGWKINMHRFIDALCDGKDLEAALNEATS